MGDHIPEIASVIGGRLTFHWIDLINGRGFNGGAILVDDAASLGFYLGEIRHCRSGNNGGAICFNSSGLLRVGNASFIDNAADGSGGAICTWNGDVDLDHVTVTRNQAGQNGGGLYVFSDPGSVHRIQHSTIVYNEAFRTDLQPQAGGIAAAYKSNGEILLESTIVAENLAPIMGWLLPNDIDAVFNNMSQWNLIGSSFSATGLDDGINRNQVGTVYVPIDPKLSQLNYHGSSTSRNYIPNPNSPAIDGGIHRPAVFSPGYRPTDQRRKPRFFGNFADIGSVERQQFHN